MQNVRMLDSERHLGCQEYRASPDGIQRRVRALRAGDGRIGGGTAVADIEDAAGQVHPAQAERIAPAECDVVAHPCLVAGGSTYVPVGRNREDAPTRGKVAPACAKRCMDAVARVVPRLHHTVHPALGPGHMQPAGVEGHIRPIGFPAGAGSKVDTRRIGFPGVDQRALDPCDNASLASDRRARGQPPLCVQVDDRLRGQLGRLAGQPDPEPVRAQGKGAQARLGAEAEAIGFIRLQFRVPAAGALYLVFVAIFQVAGERFCIADEWIAEGFALVQGIQARRPGTLAPGSANREGLV